MRRVETKKSQSVLNQINAFANCINYDSNGEYIGNTLPVMFCKTPAVSTRSIYIKFININTEQVFKIRISDHASSLLRDSDTNVNMTFDDFDINELKKHWLNFN